MAYNGIHPIPGATDRRAAAPVSELPSAAWAVATDAGPQRCHNEDAWAADPAAGLFVLADGMGGYNAGEVASSMAVREVMLRLEPEADVAAGSVRRMQLLEQAVCAANAAILAAAARRPECLGMGTTLACLWSDATTLTIGHVGDSRIYLLRDGRLMQLTRDHSVCQALIDAGDAGQDQEFERQIMGGVLTRALGVEPLIDVDLTQMAWQDGDRVLVCSDGLTDMVEDQEIGACLARSQSPEACADALVAAALAQGGHDNVTALTVFLSRPLA